MTDTAFTVRPDLGLHLATTASVLRDMAGGNHWDVPGVRAEIHRAKHLAPPDQLAHAVIAWCTTRLDLKAPIGLADDGPHWRTGRTPDTRVEAAKCAVYGHEHEHAGACRLCPTERYEPTDIPTLGPLSPEQAERNARGRALVLAAMAGQYVPDVDDDLPPARTEPDARERAAGRREDEDR